MGIFFWSQRLGSAAACSQGLEAGSRRKGPMQSVLARFQSLVSLTATRKLQQTQGQVVLRLSECSSAAIAGRLYLEMRVCLQPSETHIRQQKLQSKRSVCQLLADLSVLPSVVSMFLFRVAVLRCESHATLMQHPCNTRVAWVLHGCCMGSVAQHSHGGVFVEAVHLQLILVQEEARRAAVRSLRATIVETRETLKTKQSDAVWTVE